jgi:F-type H+-transporting ATPase subunit b
LEKLGINLGFLISQIVNFTLMVVLLTILLYKPIQRLLAERRDRIARSMADVDEARAAAARAQQDYDARIAEAQRKAQEIIGQAAQAGEKVRAEIEAEARREAEVIRQKAHEEAAAEKARVLSEVQSQIASISMTAAERVLGRAVDPKAQRELVDQVIAELGK